MKEVRERVIKVGRGKVSRYLLRILDYFFSGFDKVTLLAGGWRMSKALVIAKLAEERLFYKIADVEFEFTEVEQKKNDKIKRIYFPGIKITLVRSGEVPTA